MVGATLLTLLVSTAACRSGQDNAVSPSGVSSTAATCVEAAKTATEAAKTVPELATPPKFDISGLAGKELWLIEPAQTKAQHEIGDAFVAAAKAAGATGKVFYSDGSSKSTVEGVTQAIGQRPAGIALSVNPDLVSQQIADARTAGISVITLFQQAPGEPLPEGVQGAVPTDFPGRGADMANWILADSGCAAQAAVLHLSAYPAANRQEEGIGKVFGSCADCKLVEAPIDLAQLGTSVPSAVQAVLRANPDVDYLITLFDSLATLSAPAVASLRPEVKVVSGDGIESNLEMIRQGTEAVDVVLPPPTWIGYAVVDQLARVTLKAKPWDVSVPRLLVDKTNIGDAKTVADLFPGYENTPSVFEKAWGIS